MKKIISFIAICLALSFLFCTLPKTASAAVGKITLTGYGEVTLVPDTATICVGVKTTAETLTSANSENSEKIAKLYETLKANKINEKDIQTKNFYAHEEYSYQNGESKLIGYTVSNQVFFSTNNLENISALVSLLIEDGANILNGISFSSSKEKESYQSALSLALENAKEKAKLLSGEEMNVVEIIEESVSSFRNFISYTKAEMAPNQTLFGGELAIKARVTVIFSNEQDALTTPNKEALSKQPAENKIKNNNKNKTNDEVLTNEQQTKQEEKIDVSEPNQNQNTNTTNKNETNKNEKPITLPKPIKPTKPANSPQII